MTSILAVDDVSLELALDVHERTLGLPFAVEEMGTCSPTVETSSAETGDGRGSCSTSSRSRRRSTTSRSDAWRCSPRTRGG